MAINTFEYAKNFQQALDKQMLVGATSGWMEANASGVKYNGGDTVKMPEISVGGLAKYDRDTGFNQGSVSLKYTDYKLTQDRGRTFQLDAMDVDETNFVAAAGTVMGEFQRLQVIPEVDAFRYSKIAALAKTASHETAAFTPDKATILEKLDDEITKVQDIVGEGEPLVIIMSMPIRTILNNSQDITKYLDTADFKAGEITTKVKTYNEIPILSVPSARMKTAYVFNDGTTGGQEAGGFKPDTSAKGINWIILSRRAPIAVSNVNQKADAWKLDYRKYHDLWIPTNKLAGVWVNTGA
ncbi:MAG: hypothetical protein E7C72_08025 [Dialister sp.]|nr:hypothetical protein [Dialister sp.]